jgi:hypothetical protein
LGPIWRPQTRRSFPQRERSGATHFASLPLGSHQLGRRPRRARRLSGPGRGAAPPTAQPPLAAAAHRGGPSLPRTRSWSGWNNKKALKKYQHASSGGPAAEAQQLECSDAGNAAAAMLGAEQQQQKGGRNCRSRTADMQQQQERLVSRNAPSLKPVGYRWSYLACRIGRWSLSGSCVPAGMR